ncbi:hypothetical protein NBRC3278_3558 [Acetobacter pasteurianus NBRC 3278]|uniref:Uncharacterized protein n=1 Tax=Acetobacter pasteurianus NBRC 3278 TaxID=1226660 RepID=A0A401X992_ACEPA|nr:hypothetical protein NBRC3277_3424 [Acetobacter pasteurianus NBRC 3277]GCD64465.1 hypothetical protein NBRC3278_3558 [Acetobacter pasteurianus NBRC 3278]
MPTIMPLPSRAVRRFSKWVTRSSAIRRRRGSAPTSASIREYFWLSLCSSFSERPSTISASSSSSFSLMSYVDGRLKAMLHIVFPMQFPKRIILLADDAYRFNVKTRSDALLCPACLCDFMRWPSWVCAHVSGTNLVSRAQGHRRSNGMA